MGPIVSTLAFQPPVLTYNRTLSHLSFISYEEQSLSYITKYNVPIRYYNSNHRKTLLMCHGNAEDIGSANMENLSNLFQANICMFDYAGYGLHTNKYASEHACKQDVLAVYKYLTSDLLIDSSNIIIYGRSLGSGPACFLAHTLCKSKIPTSLILVSPIKSATSTVAGMWLPGDIFLNYTIAPYIGCKVLVLHGDQDRVVSFGDGLGLAGMFPNFEFVTLNNRGHNDIELSEKYGENIRKFITK